MALASPLNEDYFEVFGIERRFGIDRADLEKRFYQISRELHPDRFTTADAETKRRSLERMSVVNDAYRTLRSPALLRSYLIELEGAKLPAKSQGQIPMELAESWFELQDALTDDPAIAREKLATFEAELRALEQAGEKKFVDLESQIDRSSGEERRALLRRLAEAEQAQNYLASMKRDLMRIRNGLAN